jgi:hypothetical protein
MIEENEGGADYVKETCYAYDDRLKRVLDICPVPRTDFMRDENRHLNEMEWLYQMDKNCLKMRRYLAEKQGHLTLTVVRPRGLDNCDFLVFIMVYCADYHKYDSWTDFNEDLSNPYNKGIVESYHLANAPDIHCACCHPIKDIYEYTNPDTEMMFPMGNDCIMLNCVLSTEEERIIESKDDFKILCPTCREKIIKTQSCGFMGACSKCSKTHRRCEICGLYKIPNDRPDYHTKCYGCNAQSKLLGKGECRVPF